MASQICPVVGSTLQVLPPDHPKLDSSSGVCPITNAKTEDHLNILHPHPETQAVENAPESEHMDATACPALKGANSSASITDATCPVVGPVNSHLPPDHPNPADAEEGAVCPVTKATLAHHLKKVSPHPSVGKGVCPVAGKTLDQ